jgi:chaperonin cofactor prefoldin
MDKSYFVCFSLIILILAESVAYLSLNNMYVSLSSNHDSLKVEHQALTNAYDSLSQNYSSLETDYKSLESQYNILQTAFSILQSNYSILQAMHQNLQVNYSSVQTQCDLLELNYSTLEERHKSLQLNYTSLQENFETIQAQYNLLQTSYDNLQAEYNSYAAAYQRLRDEINQRWNKQDVEPFITPLDLLVNATVLDVTGGWSNTSDWSEYWDDVKAMYDWVVDNIEYRSDGLFPVLPDDPSDETSYLMEMWQFPNETLTLEKGDCEDMAILLCSMIRCYNNMEYYGECIGILSSTAGHLAVQMPIADDKLVILDPAGKYCSCDLSGNIVFRGIFEETDNWLDYWNPEIGEDVYVSLVFSGYIHETFASTADYLSWMYSR